MLLSAHVNRLSVCRDGKSYEHASNACVNFFLSRVKSVPNFTLFCRKNEVFRNFALCSVILMGFKMVKC